MKKFIFVFWGALLSGFMVNAQGDSYIIQRGDVLDVTVMEHPEFSLGSIIVLPDGFVQYPALGSVKVAGMSSAQLTDSLTKALEKFVVNPMVSIFIRKIQNQQMNIFGYVNKPGQYQLYEKVDLFSAIGLAGGLKSFKKAKSVTIVRVNRKVEEFDLRLLFSADSSDSIKIPMVYAGDTVYIREPKETNWAKLSFFTTLASVLVSVLAYSRYF
ncbi:MAG: polysaccharide biosynthesis/export family protein [Bacteroidales bacterium]|nr:polysaccharide biosynthesis/export family protein [Bacteroidales bacterium]